MGDLANIPLSSYIEKYHLHSFIETGLGMGQSLSVAQKLPFKNYYSCEIDEQTYETISPLFIQENCYLSCEASKDFLYKTLTLLPDIGCLFFLDAHFPGELFFKSGKDFNIEQDQSKKYPLNQELEILTKHRNIQHDVIIIDDARLYLNQIPNVRDVQQIIKPDQEYLAITHRYIKFIARTHHCSVLTKDQGYLVFEPKENKK